MGGKGYRSRYHHETARVKDMAQGKNEKEEEEENQAKGSATRNLFNAVGLWSGARDKG